ncbi:hypothetical protein [Pseudanabaena sp. 'Roaring Creek']|uniref:hypothetical protein n=1 Tax=Pseudanabaena sp. 'Roaring Creek' TaxID=1681830 RepID=UPI0006D7C909|nr:hypothetical protein [Pseudanabaena sp. 'Roaring Creek']
MPKFILRFLLGAIPIAIVLMASETAAQTQTMGEYLDSNTPQVIEKISGNIITFKNTTGESHAYYVPSWMIEKYNLNVGTSASLYNRNIIQGIYRDRYIDVVRQGLPQNMVAFRLHDTEMNCTIPQSPASEGLMWGKPVWYKTESCPSAIPIVGSMSLYIPRALALSETK